MSAHLAAEELLALLDGQLSPPETARLEAHLRDCADCLRRYESHCDFEAMITPVTAMPAALRASTRAVTRAALARRTQRGSWTRWTWPLAAAAALLVGFTLWVMSGPVCEIAIHRTAAGTIVRAGAADLLHLEVVVSEPAYVALFARHADGRAQRLLPHADPNLGDLGVEQPLRAGSATRLPGDELFDFAIEPLDPIVELVLVVADRRLDDTELAALAAAIAAVPLGQLPPEVVSAYPRSQRRVVPDR